MIVPILLLLILLVLPGGSELVGALIYFAWCLFCLALGLFVIVAIVAAIAGAF